MKDGKKKVWIVEDMTDAMIPQYESLFKSNEYIGIVHCWQGRMQWTINDKEYLLTPDKLFLCFPSTFVGSYMRSPDCKCGVACLRTDYVAAIFDRNLHIDPHWLDKYSLLMNEPVVDLDEKQKDLVSKYQQLLFTFLSNEQNDFRETMILRLVDTIFMEASYAIEAKLSIGSEKAPVSQADHLFRRFIALLHREYIYHHDVNWYAEQLFVTPQYLTAVCTEMSRIPASKWIRNMLTDEIRHRLVNTDIPIKDISYSMGFSTQSAFGKFVRQTLGESPIYFREHNRLNLSKISKQSF